jgi:transcriptional regulator, AraC family
MENQFSNYEQERDQHPYLYCALAKDTRCLPHYHRSLELIYVIEGSFKILINGNLFTSRFGDLFLIPPQYTHSIEKGNSLSVTVIIPVLQLQPYFETLGADSLPIHMDDYLFNRNRIQPLLQELITADQRNLMLRIGCSQTVLGRLYDHYGCISLNDRNNSLFIQIIRYLENNASQELSLKSVSDHFGYSSFHFSKLFHKNMNCSFRSYLNEIRLRKIAQALTIDSNIVDLAYRNGFKSISTFYRQFHEIYGMSPSQYLVEKSKNNSET